MAFTQFVNHNSKEISFKLNGLFINISQAK